MQFNSGQSIYLQISDYICENILQGRWQEEDRIPSIREMAVDVEVNPNTVMRSYAHLQEQGIIENRRGIGYFVSPGGYEETRRMKQQEFVEQELPRVFHMMQLINMSLEELTRAYERYLKEHQSQGVSK
jgi:DNA-binding transcriptional regulator YhcF (GntR family)